MFLTKALHFEFKGLTGKGHAFEKGAWELGADTHARGRGQVKQNSCLKKIHTLYSIKAFR